MSQRRSLSFFRRKKEAPKPTPQSISSDLAMKIIEKELDLEKSCDATTIHELMALYTKAIEYYEQNNNPKFYDFQDRMHKMLIKPQVISALQRLNCPNPIDPPESLIADPLPEPPSFTQPLPEPANIPLQLSIPISEPIPEPIQAKCPLDLRKEQAEKTRKILSKQFTKVLTKPKAQRNFNIIIDRHSSSSKETSHRAAADFKSQDSALERRLASRKRLQFTRSMSYMSDSSNDLSRVFGCDLSDVDEEIDNSTKSSFFVVEEQGCESSEKFEKRLEEIMEKNFSERGMQIAEIKFRYENQINEICGMGDIMDLLVKQMRVNMQEEVDTVVKDFDMRRKEEIKKLKEEFSQYI